MTDQTKKRKSLNFAKSFAWLIETAARAAAGYLILSNYNHIVTTIVAMYFLVTATALLVTHFVKAYAK